MADAKKCDRCGKYFDFYEDRSNQLAVVVRTRGLMSEKRKDLCPECTEALDKFMNECKEKDNA